MNTSTLLVSIILLGAAAYLLGRRRALALAGGDPRRLAALPQHHGALAAYAAVLSALLVWLLWAVCEERWIVGRILADLEAALGPLDEGRRGLLLNDLRNLAAGAPGAGSGPDVVAAAERYAALKAAAAAARPWAVLGVGALGLLWAWLTASPQRRARVIVERLTKGLLFLSSTLAILTTVGIVLSVLFESLRFFRLVPVGEFLFGLHWSPQIAIRADQQAASGAFGIVPLFVGTALISGIAMAVAVPVGLMSAIYLSEYAPRRLRTWVKPALEVLAGIPTVVYGVFAALTVAPAVRALGERMGLEVASESALAAGLVMGVMIIPFISSLADDIIHAVPQSLRDGALALGATRSEAIRQVVLPAALPGIVGGILLAVSRAIGETMIVVMAAGLAANLTFNPLDSVTTVTVQIVTLLVGDQAFDSAKTLAAFALGLVLFVVTLMLNIVALRVVRRYREQYE